MYISLIIVNEGRNMSVILHIDSLKKKHSDLENSISLEYSRPLPDTQIIADLKHRKLAIKDEIVRLAS